MSDTPKNTSLTARLPWIIAAIAIVALAANLFITRSKPAADEAAVAQLTERLNALEAGEGGSRASAANRPGMPGAPGADGGLGSMREPLTAEQAAAEQDKKLKELEGQFARDAADPVGGPKTENTLVQTVSGETMAGTGLKPNDVDIACKKNSCRIVGTFDRMGDAQDWALFYITAAGGNVLSQTQMVYVPKPGGKTEVRVYSTRAKG